MDGRASPAHPAGRRGRSHGRTPVGWPGQAVVRRGDCVSPVWRRESWTMNYLHCEGRWAGGRAEPICNGSPAAERRACLPTSTHHTRPGPARPHYVAWCQQRGRELLGYAVCNSKLFCQALVDWSALLPSQPPRCPHPAWRLLYPLKVFMIIFRL